MTTELRAALLALATTLPPDTPVPVPAKTLIELLDGHDQDPPAPPRVPAPADRLLTAREVAARLGVSLRYIYAHSTDYPFTKRLPSGALRFSDRGLARFLERT